MNEDWITYRLRTAKLRPTIVRRQVLEVLMNTSECLGTEDVYRKLVDHETHTSVGSVYRALRDMNKAGILLSFWDASRMIRYRLPTEDETLSLRIVCHSNGGEVRFSDPDLYARILTTAARQGLNLAGQGFELHASFEQQNMKQGKSVPLAGSNQKWRTPC
jgi:Fe2+ or Zn2+ uptake regulation protein